MTGPDTPEDKPAARTTRKGSRRTAGPEKTAPGADAATAAETEAQETPAADAANPVTPESDMPAPDTPDTAAPEQAPAPPEPAPDSAAVPDTPEPESVPVAGAPAADPPPPPAAPRRGGFAGLVAGGVLAAAIGFALARFVVPEGWPVPAAPSPELAAAQERIAALETRLAGLDPAAFEDRIAALAAEVAATGAAQTELAGRIEAAEAYDSRLAELEARPDLSTEFTALQAELANLRGRIEDGADPALIEEIEALTAAAQAEREAAQAERKAAGARAAVLEAEAERTVRAAVARGALLRAQAAVEAGGALAPALADLEAAGIVLPATLTGQAAGVETLLELQDGFPAAARAALAAAPEDEAGADLTGRVTAFLRAQTGARSLTPREGGDTDAVLSRSEAALRAGDLTAALAELDMLAPAPAAAMADWRARAGARADAVAALADLAAALDGE